MCHVEALNAKCLSSPKKVKTKIPPKDFGKVPSPVKPNLLTTSPQQMKCDRRKAAKRTPNKYLLEGTQRLSDTKCNNIQDFPPEIVEASDAPVHVKKNNATRKRKRKCNTIVDDVS